jgi:NADH-dependent peroxiredoxin subunit C
MSNIDSPFPHFSLETYNPKKDDVKRVKNADFEGSWLILFFYPADFTFVCPTELMDMNRHADEFTKEKTEVVVVSTDTVYTHKAWIEAEELLKGLKFVMAADHNGRLSRELNIYDEEKGMAQRATFIIDPKRILRASYAVTDDIGRSAQEILRMLKALRFVEKHPGKVCPASWEMGEPTLSPSIKIAGKVYGELNKK